MERCVTITLTITCACGAKERVEINDDDAVPEECRTCRGREATPAPKESKDMWNLTVVSPKRNKRHVH